MPASFEYLIILFLKCFHFLCLKFGNRKGKNNSQPTWALTIPVCIWLLLALRACVWKASNPIQKHPTGAVPGQQLMLWVQNHMQPSPGRDCNCPVHKRSSTYCHNLTLLSRPIIWSPPLWFDLRNTSLRVHVSVSVPPPCLEEYSVCVCIFTYLYNHSKVTFLVGKTKTKSGGDTSFAPLHSHRVFMVSFLCHASHHAAPTFLWSWFLLSAKNVWLVNCWMYHMPILLKAQNYCSSPWIVVWATRLKLRYF